MLNYEKIAKRGYEIKRWVRFNHCQAWLSEERFYIDGIWLTFIRSYNTIVAIADHTNERFVRLGKWSQTTSKQSTQIRNTYFVGYENIQL